MFALYNRTFTVSGQETPSTGRKEDVCFQKKLNIPDTPPLAPSGTSKLTTATKVKEQINRCHFT